MNVFNVSIFTFWGILQPFIFQPEGLATGYSTEEAGNYRTWLVEKKRFSIAHTFLDFFDNINM